MPSAPQSRGLHRSNERDVPAFRSVLINNQLKRAPIDISPFAPIGLSPPPLLRKASLPMKSTSSGNKLMKVNSSAWKVNDSMIRPLPEDYDVARTSRFIVGAGAPEICARLVVAFKKLSIIAVYDSEKVKAKCITKDFVKLQIRLHRGRGEYSHGIIVESVRRCGPRMDFLKESNAILNAAEGLKPIRKEVLESPHMRHPVSSLKCLSEAQELSNFPLSRESEAMDKIGNLLNDECQDSHVLGMEYLCSLLNQSESSTSMNKRAASAVIFGMNIPVIHDKVSSYLKDDYHGDIDEDVDVKLHSLSLCAIRHCLRIPIVNSCGGNSELAVKHFLRRTDWILNSLVPLLVENVNLKNPHDALTATQALNDLVPYSVDVRKKVLECEGLSIFEKAIEENLCVNMTYECECMLKVLR